MDLREDVIQVMYEMVSENKGCHDEVESASLKLEEFALKDMPESSEEYDKGMSLIYGMERTAFFAGANMVLDFISGKRGGAAV